MKYFRYFLFGVFVLSLWFWRLRNGQAILKQGKTISIEGVLREEPQLIGQSQVFHLSQIRIRARRYPELHYGDRIAIVGKLSERVINKYYSRWSANYPEITVISSNKGNVFSRWINRLRGKLNDIYRRTLPEPAAALLAGIVLGVKSDLPGSFYRNLRSAGLIHVVVASGANVIFVFDIVAEALNQALNRRWALMISLPVIWVYALLAGGDAPVIRAAIMANFAILAGFFGRQSESMRILVITAIIMALITPTVIFELGFQLSFAATAGILLFEKKIDVYIRRLPGNSLWGDSLATTLSAQVLTTPLLLTAFGRFYPLSLVSNALLLWLVPEIMILGFVLVVLGGVSLSLAYPFALVVWVPLQFFVWGAKFFGQISPVLRTTPPNWAIWLYYGLAVAIGMRWSRTMVSGDYSG